MDQLSQAEVAKRAGAEETGLTVEFLLAVEESMGRGRPDPDDPVREDLVEVSSFLKVVHAAFSEDVILRISRVYADAARRMAEAERHVWRTNLEDPMLKSGVTFAQMSQMTNDWAGAITSLQEQTILANYRRAQEREWTENTVEHLEDALEDMGLYRRPENPPAMAFLDISGYTRLTEERGDQAVKRPAIHFREIGSVELKGITHPILVHEALREG
jgi:hypothetical protein